MSMTRDVRGPEGWKILVTFAKDTVSVTHYRREQSLGIDYLFYFPFSFFFHFWVLTNLWILATAPANEQFWFEWRLSMIFDKVKHGVHKCLYFSLT